MPQLVWLAGRAGGATGTRRALRRQQPRGGSGWHQSATYEGKVRKHTIDLRISKHKENILNPIIVCSYRIFPVGGNPYHWPGRCSSSPHLISCHGMPDLRCALPYIQQWGRHKQKEPHNAGHRCWRSCSDWTGRLFCPGLAVTTRFPPPHWRGSRRRCGNMATTPKISASGTTASAQMGRNLPLKTKKQSFNK